MTPTQAEQIAKLLQDAGSSDTAIAAMRSNAAPAVQTPQPVPLAPVTQNAVPAAQQTPQMAVPTAQYTTPVAAPTAAPTYTITQLQTALAPLLDAGKVGQIQQLVQSFGVNTLMEIPPARYGEFANGLRAMGGVL